MQLDRVPEYELAQMLLGTLGKGLPQLRGVNIRNPHFDLRMWWQ